MIFFIILSILFLGICNYFLKIEKSSSELKNTNKLEEEDPIILKNKLLLEKITKERKGKNLFKFHKNLQVLIINKKNINDLNIQKNNIVIYYLSENENKEEINSLLKEKYSLEDKKIIFSKNEKVLRCYKFIFKESQIENLIDE